MGLVGIRRSHNTHPALYVGMQGGEEDSGGNLNAMTALPSISLLRDILAFCA